MTLCVLVAFGKSGHFLMLITKSIHLINLYIYLGISAPLSYYNIIIIFTKDCHWIISKLSVGEVRISINFEKHIAKQKKRELHLSVILNWMYSIFSQTLIDLNKWKWSLLFLLCNVVQTGLFCCLHGHDCCSLHSRISSNNAHHKKMQSQGF